MKLKVIFYQITILSTIAIIVSGVSHFHNHFGRNEFGSYPPPNPLAFDGNGFGGLPPPNPLPFDGNGFGGLPPPEPLGYGGNEFQGYPPPDALPFDGNGFGGLPPPEPLGYGGNEFQGYPPPDPLPFDGNGFGGLPPPEPLGYEGNEFGGYPPPNPLGVGVGTEFERSPNDHSFRRPHFERLYRSPDGNDFRRGHSNHGFHHHRHHCWGGRCYNRSRFPASTTSPTIPAAPTPPVIVPTPPTILPTILPPLPPVPSARQCQINCPSTPEYNPVCGTNGVTYNNMGRLICAKECGVEVTVLCESKCELCSNASSSSTEITPTISPSDQRCVDNCRNSVTSEYLPVCGSDDVTYNNIGMLMCAKTICGLDIVVKRRSVCASTPRPPTSSATTPRTELKNDFQQCMKSCPISNPNVQHVCGTDGISYMNVDRLNCAKRCGKDVNVLCEQPCIICSAKANTASTTESEITTVSIKQCIDSCPRMPQYNPVCGTNNVDYDNPRHLECAQYCGEQVKVLCEGKCARCNLSSTPVSTETAPTNTNPNPPTQDKIPTWTPPITPTANTTEAITIPPEEIQACINNCSDDTVNEPICGSNNITYKNPKHIVCAQICGDFVIPLYINDCGDENGSNLPATPNSPEPPEPTEQSPATDTTLSTSENKPTDQSPVAGPTLPPSVIIDIETDIFKPTINEKIDEFSFDSR